MRDVAFIVICSYILFFALGITVASIFFLMAAEDSTLAMLSADTAVEQASPSDWIKDEQILVYDDQVIIDIPGVQWSTFADTNSMDPLLDQGANGLELKPGSVDDVHIGDVIAYASDDAVIIHRVIEKNEDEEGVYFTAKGDNNDLPDAEKIRFGQIDGVLIGILY